MIEEIGMPEGDLKKWVGERKIIHSFARLPGDASTRCYYRISTQDGCFVLMKVDPFTEQGESYPFLAIQRHLESCAIAVPKVFDFDAERGFVLLEDLGDTTLLRSLQEVSDTAVERNVYEKALDVLVDIHLRCGPKAPGPRLDAFGLRFDFEKLLWETEHTIEHFYKIHLSRKITESDESILKDGFTQICTALADEPTVFTHRDFHSRNIMVVGNGPTNERYVLIDFQDARMGPAQYDLASLLKDSYYQLEESQIKKLTEHYLDTFVKRGGRVCDRNQFMRIFDLMSVQRNFKAIGTFAAILNRRENATYLKYVGNTFENIRRVLLRYPEFSRLREVLFHYYYF